MVEIERIMTESRELIERGTERYTAPPNRAWAAEPAAEPEAEEELRLDTRAPAIDWAEIDRRDAAVLAAALEGAREVARQCVLGSAYAMRDALMEANERTADAMEGLAGKLALADAELRQTRVELAELKVKVAELRLAAVDKTRGATVIDMPLLTRREIN